MTSDKPLSEYFREGVDDLLTYRIPLPTKRVLRRKKWRVLEETSQCDECGRRDYRLVWPWTKTYHDVPLTFMESFTDHAWAMMRNDAGDTIEFRRHGSLTKEDAE